MTDTPTPRTDAMDRQHMSMPTGCRIVDADFARQLERELAEANTRIEEMMNDQGWQEQNMKIAKLEHKLATAVEQERIVQVVNDAREYVRNRKFGKECLLDNMRDYILIRIKPAARGGKEAGSISGHAPPVEPLTGRMLPISAAPKTCVRRMTSDNTTMNTHLSPAARRDDGNLEQAPRP